MNVAVHGCLDVGVSRNSLYGFDVCVERAKKSKIRMPEDMRRRAVKVDGFADAFHCAVIEALGDGCVSITDDITICLCRMKMQQMLRDGNITEASF